MGDECRFALAKMVLLYNQNKRSVWRGIMRKKRGGAIQCCAIKPISFAATETERTELFKTKSAVGIDVGLKDFAILSDGMSYSREENWRDI